MRRLALVPMIAFILAGCDCGGGPPVNQGGGELKVVENQIQFGDACPKPTDPELAVELITKQIHLRNEGNADLYINAFEVEPSRADVFLFDKAQVPETMPAGAEVAIDITFAPTQSGAVVADLTVTGEGEPVIVKLFGTGKSLPPNPAMAMSCPESSFGDSCATDAPEISFSETSVLQTSEIVVKLSNGGCPILRLDKMAVLTDTSAEGATPTTFALADGQATELTLGGGGSAEIRVLFAPEATGNFAGTLSFETNDPQRRTLSIPLEGDGVAPVLTVETEKGCGYPDPSARPSCCDFKSKDNPCTGRFTLRNAGDEPLTINRVYLQSGNTMFELADPTGLVDQQIPGRGALDDAITITYHAAIARETDYLVIESSGGNAKAELRGGSPPSLDTFPNTAQGGLQLGTGLDPTQEYWMPVSVLNVYKYNEQLPLTLRALEIEQDARSAFSLGSSADCAPTLEAGGTLERGTLGTVCIKLQPTINGGSFSGTLVVKSNDPSYDKDADPMRDWYRLPLNGEAVCNPAPVASITIPLDGTSCQSNAQCSTTQITSECVESSCHAIISPHEIVSSTGGTVAFSGVRSHDLVPGTDGRCTVEAADKIATWTWQLLSKPSTSNASITQAPGNTSPTTTLTFDKVGLYLIELKVTDLTGLESPATTFSINVRSAS